MPVIYHRDYDSLGTKTNMVDPDMGTWSYSYGRRAADDPTD